MPTYTLNNIVYTYTAGAGNPASVTGFVVGIVTATIPSTITPDANTYSVTSIGNAAFQGCATLTSVAIPNSVTSIAINGFQNCANLTSASLGNSMVSLGGYTFESCSNLTSITFPNTLTSLAGEADFRSCSKLVSASLGTSLTSISQYMFNSCPLLASITIPSSVTSIGVFAFYQCIALTSLTIPNSVTTIADQVFNGCTNLVSVTLPTNASFTIIKSGLFLNCSKLASVTIPNYVITIESSAFQFCIALTSVTIPSAVTSIGNNSFASCSNLTLVTFLRTPLLPTLGTAAFSRNPPTSVGKYYTTVTNSSTIVPFFTSTSYIDYPCFLEGTQILCFENNEEVYRPVESLRKGDLVKTIYNGYMPIIMIGTSSIYNPGNDYRFTNRLYKCSRENYPTLFEDLYITGCHSILVPSMTDDQWEITKAINGDVFVTDNHFRLIACADEKAEPFNKEGCMNIYHLALEHPDILMNYGIYANGLLVESCSERNLMEFSNMRILGEEDNSVSHDFDKVLMRQLVETY